jgi:Icc-related predicted phosphoesterase
MKIAIVSDLHLEFDLQASNDPDKPNSEFYNRPPQPTADVLVLAGDIHSGPTVVDWVRRHFSLPAVLVAGNHEAFGHELFRTIAFNRQRSAATAGHVNFIERATWLYEAPTGERARFIGATLWTDFNLYGKPVDAMALAQQQLEDFAAITIERGYRRRALHPSDTARLHGATVAFLREELRRRFDGYTIVVTHHAPSPRSISSRFQGNSLNPAFASNLESLIYQYQPALWVHGHMHESFDYMIGRTRIICNPRGYFPNELNPAFQPHLILELAPTASARTR